MENQDHKDIVNRSGKLWAGLIIVGVGSLLLCNNMGLNLPSWIFHWSNILILIGLFIGVKHKFRNGSGIILIIIGAFFTLKEALEDTSNFNKLGWPVLIIAVGLFLIFKPKDNFCDSGRRRAKWKRKFGESDFFGSNAGSESGSNINQDETKKKSNLDYLDSINVFGGSHQIIFSKNFKGGEITAVFGGCDVNLTQADFEGQIVIDVTAIFGGAKIIVPPGWIVKSEVTAVFGGLDDKRSIQPITEEQHKVLIIKGIALFGGVDIRNY